MNDVCVTAFTETASKKTYLLCPKPCFRRRNWFTNEDGVRVPKKAFSEERLTFLSRTNCDVFISYEEAITYVHPRPSQTVRGLHKVPKRRTLVQDRGKFAYHLATSWLFCFNLHNGSVTDNIQLRTSHLVEHLTFGFLISSKRLQDEVNGVVIKFNVFVSEFRPSTDRYVASIISHHVPAYSL